MLFRIFARATAAPAGFRRFGHPHASSTAKEPKDALDDLRNPVGLVGLGMLTAYTASGLIHILLVAALVILVVRLVQGRRIMS